METIGAVEETELRCALIERVQEQLRAVDAQSLALRSTLAELWLDSTPFHEQKFVCDELAVLTAQSSITTQRWLTQSYALREHPAVQD
ncbi:MAG: hypothetical protein JWO12_892, partial [Frankiales bacterium]|nr:hypothetical protein [Frankiales bacterium]